jgi:hypothetical protein
MMETRFQYGKPKSNFGIGIEAKKKNFRNRNFRSFFQKKSNCFHVFPLLGAGYTFLLASNAHRSSKIIYNYLIFDSKYGFRGPFMMENIPHTISTGGPPLVRSPLVRFPLIRILVL